MADSHPNDKHFTDEREFPDTRVYLRVKLARYIRSMALAVKLDNLTAAADEILAPQKEPENPLAILPFDDGTYWKQQERVSIETLAEIQEIRTWEPLTGADLAHLYKQAYYQELAGKINELTPKSDPEEEQLAKPEAATKPILTRALEYVATLPHPERWGVYASEFTPPKQGKTDLLYWIAHHHAFVEISSRAEQQHREVILPTTGHTPFAWLIPQRRTLAPLLRKIDLLNEQLALALSGKQAASSKLQHVKTMTDEAWFSEFAQLLGDHLKHGLSAQQAAQFHEALRKQRDQAHESLLTTMKQALRLDRQLFANQAREHLDKFRDNHNLLHEPLEALRPIIEFFVTVQALDAADAQAEKAALLLDLAPSLWSALRRQDGFDIVYAYLGYLEPVRAYLPKFLAMRPDSRHIFLPDYQNNTAWLDSHVKAFNDITEHFREVRLSAQMRTGYRTDAASQTIKVFMAGSSALELPIQVAPRRSLIDQPAVSYRIDKIHRNYIFHPAYGYAAASSPAKRSSRETTSPGFAAAKILETDDKTEIPAPEPLLDVALFNSRKQQIGNKTLTRADAEALGDIDNGLGWAGFGSEMENINAAIAWYVNKTLDLAELIPGVGEGVIAGRILLTIDEFWREGGFTKAMDLISEAPELVGELGELINHAADPESLVLMLLFGSASESRLFKLLTSFTGKKKSDQKPSGGQKPGKLAKVIKDVESIGKWVARALQELDKAVQSPMRDARVFVTTRPVLSFVVQFIANHVDEIERFAELLAEVLADEKNKGEAEQALFESLGGEQVELGKSIHVVLDELAALKLPDKVVDIEPLISVVLEKLEDFVVNRLGEKARAVFWTLDKTGALNYVNQQIAHYLVAQGLDPNIIWRGTFIPALADRFNDTRKAVVTGINEVLGAKIFRKAFTAIDTPEKITLQPEGGPFPETSESEADPSKDTAPYPSSDRPLRLQMRGSTEYGPGVPLDPGVRRGAELVFGQDFSHVRMHDGAESARMTDAFGVDGLTTGSHIFMRPGLAPNSGRGHEVFRHELAHVLQQTGMRPLGSGASFRPVRGRPELGLDYDPSRERAADRIADQAGHSALTMTSSASAAPGGLQPAGLKRSAVARILGSFSDVKKITEEAAATESKGKPRLSAEVAKTETVDTILAALTKLDVENNPKQVSVPRVFKPVLNYIRNRLSDSNYAQPIRRAAYVIAADSLADLPGAKAAASSGKAGAQKYLRRGHFSRNLEEFIFAKTGIVLGLRLKEKRDTAPNGTRVTMVNEADPVETIHLVHIYLPLIDGRNLLWQKALENTWKQTWPKMDERTRRKVREHARARFEKLGVAPTIWALTGDTYRFSALLEKLVNDDVKNDVTGPLNPADLTDPDDYATTKQDATKSKSKIGVRLGLYSERDRAGAGRHLHHLTQFLLAEYFANDNTRQPFKPRRDYPGVEWNGPHVKTIAGGSGPPIEVEKTWNGHGEKMPTMSLAASTHLSGDLHVTPKPDDEPGHTGKSQGGAVHKTFIDQLKNHPALKPEASNTMYKTYRGSQTDSQIARTIYDATQFTYRAMVEEMSGKLTNNMPEFELRYYAAVAEWESRTSPQAVSLRNKLRTAARKAAIHNDTIMKEFNWTLK